jgi:hypothetical protein
LKHFGQDINLEIDRAEERTPDTFLDARFFRIAQEQKEDNPKNSGCLPVLNRPGFPPQAMDAKASCGEGFRGSYST